jgi:hypothetical protein
MSILSAGCSGNLSPTITVLKSPGGNPNTEGTSELQSESDESVNHGKPSMPNSLQRLTTVADKHRAGARPEDAGVDTASNASPTSHSKIAPAARALLIEGTWVPSGWQGDAESPDGPLSYRLVGDDPSTQGTYDEWSYDPAKGGARGWVAVTYQFPDSNWGDAPGKDLSRRGFTRLTFRARSRSGGVTLIIKSGGHTRPGASHPASYESDPIIVTLDKSWRTYSVPLDRMDLSNVPAAFTFVLRRTGLSKPCVFAFNDIMFSGPDE